ncbi:MAG: hypothetical protein MJ120_02545 [Clostridia bacterium]|nr:hypothetical protein [Clostridia bacterium]
MDSIVALPSKIVDWLSARPQLKDINFFTEFPPINKAVPLKRAIVAVGIKELKIVDKFVENEDGILERQEYCRSADIHARLSICVPYSYGGSACHEIFTKIMDELTFCTDLNITESECGEIESDRNTSALVLGGGFKVSADFCPGETADDHFITFLDKELLCGSHIRNTEVHVTNEDKKRWDNPFYVGTYFGTGTASRTIDLGFKPRMLILFNSDCAPFEINFGTQKINLNFAFGSGNYYTPGLVITANGFKVNKENFNNTITPFNNAGMIYCYIVMK